MRLFQSCEAGSSPAGGTIKIPGWGSGPTDPPLKRRSARACGARSNRAPGAAAVRWCTAVAHDDRAPGSSPGAATIYARQADRVIWGRAVDAVSAVRVRGLVHRRDVMAALRSPKPLVGVQGPAPVPFGPMSRAAYPGRDHFFAANVLARMTAGLQVSMRRTAGFRRKLRAFQNKSSTSVSLLRHQGHQS
jgi:hypothetical protein